MADSLVKTLLVKPNVSILYLASNMLKKLLHIYYFKTRQFLRSIYLFQCSPDTFMAPDLNVLLLKVALTEKQDMRL